MRRKTLVTLAASAAIAFVAAGCCEKEKEINFQLRKDNSTLMTQKKVLEKDLSLAKGQEAQLQAAIDQKDLDIAEKGLTVAKLQRQLDAAAAKKDDERGTAVGWKRTPQGDQITVGSDVLFASGQAKLTPAGKTALNRIVTELKGRYAGLPIRVYGYTDNDPIKSTRKLWQDNLDLSANRAMAVTRYLISKGVKADGIETIAMGETRSVAPNTTPANKAKNRRVELFVVK